MVARKGYKLTEVGEIPEDWEIHPIESLCSITTGSRNTQDSVDDGAYPFFVRSQTVEKINSYSFDGEAVLTAGDGVGTGKIFHYINGKCDVHQRVYLMSHFSDNLLGYYFFLHFSTNFYDRVMKMTAKSSVDSVRREMIARMPIPVPSIVEQIAISTALSDADALIDALEQSIAKKRHIKQGAMQELLTGKRRLSGFTGKWANWELGKVLVVTHGKSQKFVEDPNGEYPILASGGKIGTANQFIYNKPSILIGRKGTIDKPQYMDRPFWAVDTLFYTQVNQNNIPKFIYYIFFLIPWHNYNEASGVPSLNAKTIESILVKLPPPDENGKPKEQTAIAAVLSDMDDEIAALEAKLAKARQIKIGMMQELLTGRIRLV